MADFVGAIDSAIFNLKTIISSLESLKVNLATIKANSNGKESELLNAAEIASLLGVSLRTVQRLANKPTFPAPIKLSDDSRLKKWRREDIDDFIKDLADTARDCKSIGL